MHEVYKIAFQASIDAMKKQCTDIVCELKVLSGTPIEVSPDNMEQVEGLFRKVGHAEALANAITNLENALQDCERAYDEVPVHELFPTSKN